MVERGHDDEGGKRSHTCSALLECLLDSTAAMVSASMIASSTKCLSNS